MIKVEHATKTFGNKKAVDDISFEVKSAENVALLGTSGCGKTTTLRMINRLIETTSGNIYIDDKNIKDVSPEELRRNIGYVLQHHGLFPHYTIAENIAIVPELLKWPKQKIKLRTERLLEQLHLPENFLPLYPQELSGGQQQRVGLARALAADPPVLLMDEPFGALDAVTRANITNEFSELDVLKNKTIVLVTHDIREAFQLGSKILLMNEGKIVQAGSAADLLFNPISKFVSDFFEGQRLQLELNAVSLKDVWPFLQAAPVDDAQHNTNLFDKSIWEILNLLSSGNDQKISIKSASSNDVKLAGYDSLFAAFNSFKMSTHE